MGQHETTDDDEEWVGMGVENGFTNLPNWNFCTFIGNLLPFRNKWT